MAPELPRRSYHNFSRELSLTIDKLQQSRLTRETRWILGLPKALGE